MTDQIKNQISAFVDDELPDAEAELLVRRLCGDTDLRMQAARYGLIGDALRGSLPQIQTGLAQALQHAIAQETRDDTEVTVAVAAAEPSGSQRFWRPLAGAAVAATVAVAAVVLLRTQTPVEPAALVADQGSAVQPGGAAPLGLADASIEYVTPRVNRSQPGLSSRLNTYLVSHSQYATTTARQGPMTYRAVGHVPQDVVPTPRVEQQQ